MHKKKLALAMAALLAMTSITIPVAAAAQTSYDYAVDTDKYLEASVASGTVDETDGETITITPDDHYAVSKLSITHGGTAQTVFIEDDTTVTVNNAQFDITVRDNGKVKLDLPAADANMSDVSVYATSELASYNLAIAGGAEVECNVVSGTAVEYGGDITLIFTPRGGNTITDLAVSINGDTEIVSTTQSKVTVDGKSYSFTQTSAGAVYFYLTGVYADVSIEAMTEEQYGHTLYVATDNGISCDDTGTHEVEDSAAMTLKFEPLYDYTVASVTLTTNGTTYTATKDDTTLAGYAITWASSGKVTLQLTDIDSSMEVYATSDMTTEYYYVTKSPDGNSSIYIDSDNTNYIASGEDFAITVVPDYGYDITTVTLKTSTGDTITVGSDTESFVMEGHEYFVEQLTNGTWYLRFPYISTSLTISSVTAQQETTYAVSANSGALNDNYNMGSTTATCTVTGAGNIGAGKSVEAVFTPNSGLEITKLNIRDVENYQNLVDLTTKSVTISGVTYNIAVEDGIVTVSCDSVQGGVYITALTQSESEVTRYTVTTDSDPADTCMVSGDTSVVAGNATTATFTPEDGYEITQFNIRTASVVRQNLVNATNGTTYIDGAYFQISTASDGTVTVSCSNVSDNLYISATTSKIPETYNLTIDTDSHITCDTDSGTITDQETTKLIFTPKTKYSIDTFEITDGDSSETVDANDEEVTVNGNTYTINWKSDGTAVLRVPPASADVTIEAASKTGSYYVTLIDDTEATSNVDDLTWVDYGEDMMVVIYPRLSNEITYVKIWMGDDYEKVSVEDTEFKIDGNKYTIEQASNGNVYVYLEDVYCNVEMDVQVSKDDDYTMVVESDEGIYCDVEGATAITQDADVQLTFVPQYDCTIEEIAITVDGTTATAKDGDTSLKVEGEKYELSWKSNGRVIVEIDGIGASAKIEATSDCDDSIHYITKNTDGHAFITTNTNNANYAEDDESVIVTITPYNDYAIDTVEISTKNDSYTLDEDTTRFILGDYEYFVSQNDNGTWSIYLSKLAASIVIDVSTSSDYGYDDDADADISDSLTSAYMVGTGSNLFEPERDMTRAEAVTLLARLYYGVADASASLYTASFDDVASTMWYDGYIGWAQEQGLLTETSLFRPTDAITRVEYVTMLCTFADVNTSAYSNVIMPYSDIFVTTAQEMAIGYASVNGWVNGYTDGTFRPYDSITRAEITAVTNRAVNRTNVNLAMGTSYFTDVPTGHWAYDYIQLACNAYGG